MTGWGYREERGFAKATHRLEGDNGMLLVDGMAKECLFKWFCLPSSKPIVFSF